MHNFFFFALNVMSPEGFGAIAKEFQTCPVQRKISLNWECECWQDVYLVTHLKSFTSTNIIIH